MKIELNKTTKPESKADQRHFLEAKGGSRYFDHIYDYHYSFFFLFHYVLKSPGKKWTKPIHAHTKDSKKMWPSNETTKKMKRKRKDLVFDLVDLI